MEDKQRSDEEAVAPSDDALSDEAREPIGEERQSAFAPHGRPEDARPVGEPPPPEG